jgi:hypothetical protein
LFPVISSVLVISPTNKQLTHHTSHIKPAIPTFELTHNLNYIRTHDQPPALNRLTNPCAGGCIHLNSTQTPPDLPYNWQQKCFPIPVSTVISPNKRSKHTKPTIPPSHVQVLMIRTTRESTTSLVIVTNHTPAYLHTHPRRSAAALTARTDEADHPQSESRRETQPAAKQKENGSFSAALLSFTGSRHVMKLAGEDS